ncbi:MAG TPA: hypothetical protein VG992_00560 [Candidatus Saccharimonadales bacterium]|nr:hypothetical protein [Candidatus Saccharimonadales bacterium]
MWLFVGAAIYLFGFFTSITIWAEHDKADWGYEGEAATAVILSLMWPVVAVLALAYQVDKGLRRAIRAVVNLLVR